jgi:ribosome assembly protein SQT1
LKLQRPIFLRLRLNICLIEEDKIPLKVTNIHTMSSSHQPLEDDDFEEEEAAMLDPDEAAEEIPEDMDAAMDSGDEGNEDMQDEIQLQNDSVAHFDLHKDSIFAIAQHPLYPNIVATGGSEGEDAGGIGYIFDSTPPQRPVLPASYQSTPSEQTERKSLDALFTLEGHTDSINALAFTLPKGEVLVSGGLDGKLRAYASKSPQARSWQFLAEAQEVEEINWLSACPHPSYANTIALGANNGSVWVYTIDASAKDDPLQIIKSYFLHTGPCTAGAWTPDGKMLATVSEDGSLYVMDVFGEAAVVGVGEGQAVVSLTAQDQRFAVEGGLYSVAISPSGAFLVVGGAGGAIKVIGLPRLSTDAAASSKAKGGKKASATSATGQAGQILADLQAQSDGIETLAFAPPPLTLLAAGSVDGSIALYDSAHRFAVRRHIKEAHEDYSVVKVEFASASPASTTTRNASTSVAGVSGGWILTSCGVDGVVRQWDTRGGTAMANSGFLQEWRGHRGEGEGGVVLGFVQGGGRIVTAGDDGIALVFEAGPG